SSSRCARPLLHRRGAARRFHRPLRKQGCDHHRGSGDEDRRGAQAALRVHARPGSQPDRSVRAGLSPAFECYSARMTTSLHDLETPALVLDTDRMDANIARMREKMQALGVTLRPHVKTCKSREVALRLSGGRPGPITVSTLKEAEQFFSTGYR